mmetsp:Transcript_43098/g.88202  ORF Transcript_43098/g.88202 Transcript_43098/m.88202 type:complete len:221 (+) Transcript_43098:337-999(+)
MHVVGVLPRAFTRRLESVRPGGPAFPSGQLQESLEVDALGHEITVEPQLVLSVSECRHNLLHMCQHSAHAATEHLFPLDLGGVLSCRGVLPCRCNPAHREVMYLLLQLTQMIPSLTKLGLHVLNFPDQRAKKLPRVPSLHPAEPSTNREDQSVEAGGEVGTVMLIGYRHVESVGVWKGTHLTSPDVGVAQDASLQVWVCGSADAGDAQQLCSSISGERSM